MNKVSRTKRRPIESHKRFLENPYFLMRRAKTKKELMTKQQDQDVEDQLDESYCPMCGGLAGYDHNCD